MNTTFRRAFTALEPELLQQGDTGSAVQLLQQALQELSFYNRSIDGCFGPETAASVRSLQNLLGLDVTGSFDLATWYGLTFWAESEQPKPMETASNKSQRRHLWQSSLNVFSP